jgi:uncharacterized membrane protein YcaP (DUF421 family)
VDQSALGTFVTDLFVPGVSLGEKVFRTAFIYLFLVALLRIGGRRELGQMNAFDLVVLLLLANATQNAIIGDDNSLLGGIVGGATLILLNLGVNWYLYGHPALDRRIEGSPTRLVKDGRLLRRNLQRELITEQELLSMIRRQGVNSIEECAEVILETSGVITVIAREPTTYEQVSQQIVARLERIERLLTERQAGAQGGSSSS